MDYPTQEGLEAPISEDAFAAQPTAREQHQTADEQQRWLDELEAARKERKDFDERGRKIIKRYADERDANEQGRSNFNVFFANTEIKTAALYARTPTPDIKRRFDDPDDQVSRVAANLLQRNITYELECGAFDSQVRQMLFDRLVPGIGIGWARFDQDEVEPQVHPLTGEAVPGTEVANQQSELDYVAWDDFLWAPARVWTLCRWVARRVPMSKAAITARFGSTCPPDVLRELPFAVTAATTAKDKDTLKPKHLTQATVDVFEVWDKERKLVLWIAEHASVPLDVQADTNEFDGFFPTPLPPLGRFTTSNTLPRSDFSLVQDQYNELDDLNNRTARLIKMLQLKWVYDASSPELKELYQTGAEGQGVPVKDWAAFASEKGGMRGSMEFAPLDEVAATYQKLVQARELVKQQIYEVEGISDILRGAPTPYESAAATNMKGQYSSSRLAVAQREVAEYIAKLLQLKAHLICKFYTPQTLLERAGTLPQADMQYVPQALQLLKSVKFSHFRLLVSVDSIQLPNWNDEKQERNELISAVTTFLSQLLPAVQQHPELTPFGMSMLKFAVAGYKGAKDIEGVIEAGIQQFTAASQQPAPQQPKPEELRAQADQQRLQAELQMTQMQEQTKLALGQLQAQLKQQELQLRTFEAQLKARAVNAGIERDQASQHIDALQAAHAQALDMAGLAGGSA